MTNEEFLRRERERRLQKRQERIKKVYSLSEGIIPEEQRPAFKERVTNDIDLSLKPIGYHTEQALRIIAYLNNEEVSAEEAYNKFVALGHSTIIEELKVAEIIRDFSARGAEFFTIAYEAIRPRLEILKAETELFVKEHPDFFKDLAYRSEQNKQMSF